MGTSYQFICKHCDYEAVVSGGDDVGMACRTTTICCEDCGELYDVVTSEEPWNESIRLPDEKLVCPGIAFDESNDDENTERLNPNHRVHRWTFPGSCPKCGEPMAKGGAVMNWD